eukprot:5715492-Prymnesium_polylepis.1
MSGAALHGRVLPMCQPACGEPRLAVAAHNGAEVGAARRVAAGAGAASASRAGRRTAWLTVG